MRLLMSLLALALSYNSANAENLERATKAVAILKAAFSCPLDPKEYGYQWHYVRTFTGDTNKFSIRTVKSEPGMDDDSWSDQAKFGDFGTMEDFVHDTDRKSVMVQCKNSTKCVVSRADDGEVTARSDGTLLTFCDTRTRDLAKIALQVLIDHAND